MPNRALKVQVEEVLLADVERLSQENEELKSLVKTLASLFVYEGVCQQCGGVKDHLEWCLVGKAEKV